jgi:hypothetical protein
LAGPLAGGGRPRYPALEEAELASAEKFDRLEELLAG